MIGEGFLPLHDESRRIIVSSDSSPGILVDEHVELSLDPSAPGESMTTVHFNRRHVSCSCIIHAHFLLPRD